MNLFFFGMMLAALVSGIGGVLVFVIVPFWLFYICSNRENTLLWSIAKRRSAKTVMDELIDDYRLNRNAYRGNKYKILFPKIISDALTNRCLPPSECNCFTKVRDNFSQVFSDGVIWNAQSTLIAHSNQRCYKRLKSHIITTEAQRRVEYPNAFSLICKDYRVWLYPNFIILETRNTFKLLNWSDFECMINAPILLKEDKVIQNKYGVEPYSIQYLHSNKDGSPDRRYKSNPCSLVYLFTPLVMKFKEDEIMLIALRKEDATRIQSTVTFYRSHTNSVNLCEKHSDNKVVDYDPESIINTII